MRISNLSDFPTYSPFPPPVYPSSVYSQVYPLPNPECDPECVSLRHSTEIWWPLAAVICVSLKMVYGSPLLFLENSSLTFRRVFPPALSPPAA